MIKNKNKYLYQKKNEKHGHHWPAIKVIKKQKKLFFCFFLILFSDSWIQIDALTKVIAAVSDNITSLHVQEKCNTKLWLAIDSLSENY